MGQSWGRWRRWEQPSLSRAWQRAAWGPGLTNVSGPTPKMGRRCPDESLGDDTATAGDLLEEED